MVVSFLFIWVVFASASADITSTTTNEQHQQPPLPLPMDFLDESSVVLITGMAGFLGSELAMALHRVYKPQKIIGVDSMDDGFGQEYRRRTAEALGVFDFKRQRLFHVLQTLQSSCHFYRVDFRPNIPDYQDRGEVPVLKHIFDSHPDITHVVHLADPYGPPSLLEEGNDDVRLTTQAVPRKKEQIKAGMMEALLEQLRKSGKMNPEGRIPHFVYASSSHVYNHYDHVGKEKDSPNPPPFAEDKPITTPSSIHGASKLLDEILAKTYHQTQGIYSVGLRFFDVYGPWGSPGSLLFDLAERAVRGGDFISEAEERILDKVTRDYIYIEDAVDALMAAMQFRPTTGLDSKTPPPVVINVGSGEGTTVRSIVRLMKKFLATTVTSKLPPPRDVRTETKRSISYASKTRAKELLGFESRISLEEGILHLLSWHHDRAFPYGSIDQSSNNPHPLEFQGFVACSPLDAECLRGTPVFPCASECSHRHQCTPSFYDSVTETTRQLTAPCEAVLYTVNLDNDLTSIPSAAAAVSTTSQSHVVNDDGHCNLAFVSARSQLVQKLQQNDFTTTSAPRFDNPLKHGFWTLVLVDVKKDEQKEFFLEFLPKLSPGLFFGGEKTKRIIYCEPDVLIDSIPKLLAEAAMQPLFQHTNDNGHKDPKKNEFREGATAMLIGKGRQSQNSHKGLAPLQEAVQDSAYRSVRISVIDHMSGDSFAQSLDTSFIVHTLQSEDAHLFRCDVFEELIQWEVGSDQSAFSFILELHNMWSSVVVQKAGLSPWWVGEDVVTIPERATSFSNTGIKTQKRKLLEALALQVDGDNNEAKDPDPISNEKPATNMDAIDNNAQNPHLLPEHENSIANEGDEHNILVKEEFVEGKPDDSEKAAAAKREANFGDGDDQVTGEQGPDEGAELLAAGENVDTDDDTTADDDNNEDEDEEEDADIPSRPEVLSKDRDVSAYDTWMGVISSTTSLQYFVRIVPSSEAGVVVLDDYEF